MLDLCKASYSVLQCNAPYVSTRLVRHVGVAWHNLPLTCIPHAAVADHKIALTSETDTCPSEKSYSTTSHQCTHLCYTSISTYTNLDTTQPPTSQPPPKIPAQTPSSRARIPNHTQISQLETPSLDPIAIHKRRALETFTGSSAQPSLNYAE